MSTRPRHQHKAILCGSYTASSIDHMFDSEHTASANGEYGILRAGVTLRIALPTSRRYAPHYSTAPPLLVVGSTDRMVRPGLQGHEPRKRDRDHGRHGKVASLARLDRGLSLQRMEYPRPRQPL